MDGPLIVVTTIYLSGTLPLSAQLANAIANDRDALFPVIAIAPKAAIAATLYRSTCMHRCLWMVFDRRRRVVVNADLSPFCRIAAKSATVMLINHAQSEWNLVGLLEWPTMS